MMQPILGKIPQDNLGEKSKSSKLMVDKNSSLAASNFKFVSPTPYSFSKKEKILLERNQGVFSRLKFS